MTFLDVRVRGTSSNLVATALWACTVAGFPNSDDLALVRNLFTTLGQWCILWGAWRRFCIVMMRNQLGMRGDVDGHEDLPGHMTKRPIDEHATRIPQSSGLLPCLYVPIGARDRAAISLYVGDIVRELSRPSLERAFLVAAHEPDQPDERLPIWGHPRAPILHSPMQVWVHVDYAAYRRAYARAFPDDCLDNRVIDHVMNRRVARLKGFAFLRVVPISRPTNSSHGGLSEGWGVDLHSSPAMQERNRTSEAMVQYADIADIVKMLDMEGGGWNMSIVNDAQKLVDLPAGE